MKSARTLAIMVVFSLVLGAACDGCGACTDERLEADADTRVTALANLLPATTDAAIVIPELSELPDALDYTFGRLEHVDPDARALENQINQVLGLRVTDIESWDAAGFAPDSSMMFSMVGGRPVMAAYLDDKNAFQTHFVGRLRERTETSVPIQENAIGDRDFQVSGTGPVSDMAWFHDDAIVVLVFPPLSELEALNTGSAISVANKLGTVDEDTSLAGSKRFADFRQGLGNDYPLSLYVDAERYFERPEVADESFDLGPLGAVLESLMHWSQSHADATGIGYRAGDQRIEMHAFAAGDDEFLEEARQSYATDADTEWDGLLTENTTVAARTGFDLSGAAETFFDSLSDEEREMAKRQLDGLGRDYDLDIEDDILAALSGHSLLVFYGVGGDITSAMRPFSNGDIFTGTRLALANSGLLINLHFEDPEKLSPLLSKIGDAREDVLDHRPIDRDDADADIAVLQPRDLSLFPFRIFATDRSATIATAGIGEAAMYDYLTDNRDESSLADVEELRLGPEFADAQGLNGLYVNFANIRSNMRNIPLLAGYANTIRMVHELLITAGVDDHGFYLSTKLDFSDPLQDDEDQ